MWETALEYEMERCEQLGQRGTRGEEEEEEEEGGESVIFCSDLGWGIADDKLNGASFPQRCSPHCTCLDLSSRSSSALYLFLWVP